MNPVITSDSILADETAEPVGTTAPAVEKPRKPRVWTVFGAWLAAAILGEVAILVAVVVVGAGAGVFMGAQGADADAIRTHLQEFFQNPLLAYLMRLIPYQFGMLAVVLFAAWRSKEPFKQRIGLVPQTGRAFGQFRLATMSAFTVSTAFISLVCTSLLLGPLPADNIIADGSWWSVSLLSIVLSVLPALVEELLFRGYIQRRFLRRWSPAVAIGVTSLLFALMHADSLQHIFAVVPLAVVLGLLAHRTGSVKPGMIVHAIHNAAVVGIGVLFTALAPVVSEQGLGVLMFGGIGVLGLIGLTGVLPLMRGEKSRPEAVEFPVASHHELALPQFLTNSGLASQAV